MTAQGITPERGEHERGNTLVICLIDVRQPPRKDGNENCLVELDNLRGDATI